MNRSMTLSVTLVLMGLLLHTCNQQDDVAKKQTGAGFDTLRVGIALQAPSALLMVAEDQNFFADQGLYIDLKTYPSGKRALQEGLYTQEVDVVSTSDVPFVFGFLDDRDIAIFAQIGSSDFGPAIVARTDAGIHTPADLKGKRIGTQKASAVHFFLHMFHSYMNFERGDFELSYYKAEDLPQALASGQIDAFSMREPYISQARELLGDRVIVFTQPGLTFRAECLVGEPVFLDQNSEKLEKLLRALQAAIEFSRSNPGQAMQIVAARLNVTHAELIETWDHLKLELTLPQVLVLNLEGIAMWANDVVLKKPVEDPNFLRVLFTQALRRVDPEAVTVRTHR